MKFQKIIFILSVCFLISCKESQENKQPNIPSALEDKKSSSVFDIDKRGNKDMIESIFEELKSNDTNLQEIENTLIQLNQFKEDSISTFTHFNSKNQSYYMAANNHINQINDSVLKVKIQQLISNNINNYNTKIATHTDLISIINKNELSIADYYNVLKIVKTLPIIEKYQKENYPPLQPLQSIIKEQDKVKNQLDTITNLK